MPLTPGSDVQAFWRHSVWQFCHSRICHLPCKLASIHIDSKVCLKQEQTIRTPVEFQGVGLHSGAPVHLRILPAPAGSGIVFRRTDLDGFEVEAISRNV